MPFIIGLVRKMAKGTEKKYTAHDIARFCNVTKETLRHYESVGLIHPLINKENNYRMYSDYDVETVVECRRWRSMDLSIPEIRQLYEAEHVEACQNILQHNHSRLQEEITRLQRQNRKNQELLNELQEAREHLDQVSLEQPEAFWFSSCYEDFYQYDKDPNLYRCFSQVPADEIGFADFSMIIPRSVFLDRQASYQAGIAISVRWAEELQLSDGDMQYIQPGKCAVYTTELEHDFLLSQLKRQRILSVLNSQGLQMKDTLYVREIIHLKTCRLMKYLFPVEPLQTHEQ